MEYVRLGRSGLISSVIGLGGGSSSRFGLTGGGTKSDALKLIHRALDLGITFFDGGGVTGGVDELLRDGLCGSRDGVLLSTKIHLGPDPVTFSNSRRANQASSWIARRFGLVCSTSTLRARVELTLRSLGTDRIDLLHLHAVSSGQYRMAAAAAVPLLLKMKEEGKLRAIGITEQYQRDPRHEMLREAVADASIDTVMVGFNFMNRGATEFVLPAATKTGIGVIGMFAVRGLGRECGAEFYEAAKETGAPGVAELAYRYCRHQPGISIVLTGTGNPDHLRQNVEAALLPPLPSSLSRRLETWSDERPQAEASTRK